MTREDRVVERCALRGYASFLTATAGPPGRRSDVTPGVHPRGRNPGRRICAILFNGDSSPGCCKSQDVRGSTLGSIT